MPQAFAMRVNKQRRVYGNSPKCAVGQGLLLQLVAASLGLQASLPGKRVPAEVLNLVLTNSLSHLSGTQPATNLQKERSSEVAAG